LTHFVCDELEFDCIKTIFIKKEVVATGNHGSLTGSARDQVKELLANQEKAKQVSFRA